MKLYIYPSLYIQIAKLARDLKKQLNIGFDSPAHIPPLAAGKGDSGQTAAASGLRTVTSDRDGFVESSGRCWCVFDGEKVGLLCVCVCVCV